MHILQRRISFHIFATLVEYLPISTGIPESPREIPAWHLTICPKKSLMTGLLTEILLATSEPLIAKCYSDTLLKPLVLIKDTCILSFALILGQNMLLMLLFFFFAIDPFPLHDDGSPDFVLGISDVWQLLQLSHSSLELHDDHILPVLEICCAIPARI